MARPKGSTNKLRLRDCLSKKEIEKLVAKANKKALEGDSILLKFLLEQVYGKAVQPISGDEDNPLSVKVTGIKYILPNGSDTKAVS